MDTRNWQTDRHAHFGCRVPGKTVGAVATRTTDRRIKGPDPDQLGVYDYVSINAPFTSMTMAEAREFALCIMAAVEWLESEGTESAGPDAADPVAISEGERQEVPDRG